MSLVATYGPNISIHAPSRGRQLTSDFWPVRSLFQSTPPRGGDIESGFDWPDNIHFNPRPLAGATHRSICSLASSRISIHAPSRGRHGNTYKKIDGA